MNRWKAKCLRTKCKCEWENIKDKMQVKKDIKEYEQLKKSRTLTDRMKMKWIRIRNGLTMRIDRDRYKDKGNEERQRQKHCKRHPWYQKIIPGTEGVPGGAFLLGEVGMGGDLYLVHLDIVGIGGASCWSWNCLLSIELLLFSFHRTSLNFSSCPCLASSYSSLGMCSKNSGLCH